MALGELEPGWANDNDSAPIGVVVPVCEETDTEEDFRHFWCGEDHDHCLSLARRYLVTFWGFSGGSSYELALAESRLRELDLSFDQINRLRVSLPLYGDGTTAQKVERIDRVLKRLEYEAKGG